MTSFILHFILFSTNPNRVVTDIWLTGHESLNLPTTVRDLIYTKTRQIIVNGRIRYILGTLLITPESGGNSTVIVIPIEVNPTSTIIPTPTITPTSTIWIGETEY